MTGSRVLITGAAGQLAFPVAADLAASNEVWGIARFSQPGSRDRLEQAGIRTAAVDLAEPDWQGLPTEFDYLLHFAADITGDDFDRALRINAEGTGLLMDRCAGVSAALIVSTTAVYDLNDDPEHRFTETDPLGDSKPAFGRTYPISKIAQEAVARSECRRLGLPTTIARMNLSYGSNGGFPAYQLDALRNGDALPVAAEGTFHNPIHEADVVASVPRLLDVASVPATITNWAGNDTVSMREYCAYLAELEGLVPEFAPVAGLVRSRAVDTTRQLELIGLCQVPWREGMARMARDRATAAQ